MTVKGLRAALSEYDPELDVVVWGRDDELIEARSLAKEFDGKDAVVYLRAF